MFNERVRRLGVALATATFVGILGASQVVAHEEKPADNTRTVIGKNPKLVITCDQDASGKWGCKVRSKNGKFIQEKDTAPPDITDIEVMEILLVEAYVPDPHGKETTAAEDSKLDGPGPHCWVKVAGKWTLIHC